MKAKFTAVLYIAVTWIFVAPQVATCQEADWVGEWVTTNPQTRGITRILISKDDPGWFAQTFGRCQPRDCDWGRVPLHLLGASVEDESFTSGFAIWDAGFATKYVTIVKGGDALMVETVTIFRDRSRRANFRARESLTRPSFMQ